MGEGCRKKQWKDRVTPTVTWVREGTHDSHRRIAGGIGYQKKDALTFGQSQWTHVTVTVTVTVTCHTDTGCIRTNQRITGSFPREHLLPCLQKWLRKGRYVVTCGCGCGSRCAHVCRTPHQPPPPTGRGRCIVRYEDCEGGGGGTNLLPLHEPRHPPVGASQARVQSACPDGARRHRVAFTATGGAVRPTAHRRAAGVTAVSHPAPGTSRSARSVLFSCMYRTCPTTPTTVR